MGTRATLLVLAALAGGCSTYINDTAPTKTPNSVYAVGSKQGFFTANSTVWNCSTAAETDKDCTPVEVEIK
jgi:uncharacterized protein YceK